MQPENKAMCKGELVFWLTAGANVLILIYGYRTSRSLETHTSEMEKLWRRRLDEAEKLRIHARKLRDEWKIANVLSKAMIGAQKDDSE
jgi:hypothetical protein